MLSHLTILETTASIQSSAAVFKVPCLDPAGNLHSWQSISYSQFQADVELFARYWHRTLTASHVPQRSVVGLWIGGMAYTDVLHIYGLSRAGYVPQLFSLKLPNPEVIFELLHRARARALIHDPSYSSILVNSPVPTHLAIGRHEIPSIRGPLPPVPAVTMDDYVFIFHTSGSTSGSPKLVPCSYRWLASVIHKAGQVCRPKRPERQDVSVWMGSMCHIAQTFMLIGHLQHGSCIIQPTVLTFPSSELMDMIHRCGLNRLNQFPTFLANHIRNARADARLLSMLRSLDEVLYTGLPLAREEEEYAYKSGINLRTLFGSTECNATMISIGGHDRHAALLRPLEGMSYRFVPIASDESSESGHQTTARLLELVVLPDSRDCPDASLRKSDGLFHTGDLFQEAIPGAYVYRGRDDDWIKSENGLRCDTRAIEDNVRAMCGDLIGECVVVGAGRPWPALFVEPANGVDHSKLKKDIIRKTRQFHSRRYIHERIQSADMIIVVPPKTLPRTATKGNIRRKAVEDAYKIELDRLYAASR